MKLLKNINNVIVLFGVLITLSACNDYIEEDIFSDITSDNFINEENADQLVVGVYASMRNVYRDYTFKFDGTDIFANKGNLSSLSATNDYFNLTSSAGQSLWANNYGVIGKANIVVSRYENQVEWSDSNLEAKAYGIAQARGLRGLAYFNLVQQYGGVVLQLEEDQVIRTDYVRSSEQETYNLIIADLEAAIPVLEDAPETGRFSKRAAQHVLAEVYLTRGYTSFGESTDFATAAALAEEAIGGYDIRSQSYAKVFAYSNQVNDEVLFAMQWGSSGFTADKDNNKHSLFMNQVSNYPGVTRSGNPYGFSDFSMMPTPFYYSLFAANDTRDDVTFHRVILADDIDELRDADGVLLDNIIAGDTVVYYPKEALDASELAAHLDRHWVYQPDEYLFGRPDAIAGVNYLYTLNPEQTNFPIFKKFDDEDFNETRLGARDTYVFRVAETHLIAAEAFLAAGNSSQALFHINRVRERATGVANEYATVTIDDILNERALELAGEDNRWAVLKRTGKLEERIALYNPQVINHGAFDASVHLLRPIPTSELQLSDGSLDQNPGY
ncbi:RagB/SusD family nutrient uptake outer membrane protein [Cellulophaga sp. E16_2]|uniref:RagB/SusD family nutrient uptake outer membrane protein n=1 Tax=Cellulophaga sp. E16_2 TaxID=2789297 RepID=UPI001A91617F|nr:RagB/SusD family nutrient uptake outer membrane protein [Cellulophaga sp. E16_2]MBO0590205.1 RagB/SusD family nutrient uptake outer membrane protein [Cellulophaga sp. E16_2]